MVSFERRIRSYAIDTSLAFILVILVIFLKIGGVITSVTLAYILCLICYVGVMTIPYLFNKGQTFGKRVEKLQVVYVGNNQVPNCFILILREILKIALTIFTYGIYVLVAGFIFNMRDDGRTIHDFIFKTKVICLTRYITDNKEQYINRSASLNKSLKGSSYDD